MRLRKFLIRMLKHRSSTSHKADVILLLSLHCHPELVSGPQPAPLSFRAPFLKSTFYKILACARMTEGQHGRKIPPKYKISRPKMRKSHHTRPFFKPLKSFRGFILRFFVKKRNDRRGCFHEEPSGGKRGKPC